MSKNSRILSLLVFFVFILSSLFISIQPAYATNGTRELGFSARDSAMAGATTASPEDTSCLVRNPAGLVWIGNRIDAMYQNILPHNVTMHTEGLFSNPDHRQKSTVNYIPGVDMGISYRIPGTDKYPVSVGAGLFTMAGISLDYPSTRLNPAIFGTNGYDKMIDLRSMRIAPGISVAYNEKLSFGAAANIAIQALKTDLATSTAPYTETAGSGKWDFVPGAGFTLGLLYKFHEMLDVGVCYESHGWMGHHHKYKDVLPYIDEPPIINVGLSFKPIKELVVTYDTRYINWTDVKLARNGPESGGFGWGDQWVFATGAEYSFKDKNKNDKFKLRLGYDYGKAPVQSHVVFANALLPATVMEHHLTTGFSYFLLKDLSFDFVWEHHFMGVKADNGCGDVYSRNGAGTKITAAADIISVGLGYIF